MPVERRKNRLSP